MVFFTPKRERSRKPTLGQRLGIVDVPGHEKFVKNMVAGATGIDIVAMIIAADEGVMHRPPRRPGTPMLTAARALEASLVGLLMAVVSVTMQAEQGISGMAM